MTRQRQVIERLQTFVFDPKSMTELKNFDVSQCEDAQAFIIKVQKLMHNSRRSAFNDWNYGNRIVIGEIIAGFSRWLLKWYLPPKERPVENQQWQWAILLMGILIAVSGIYRQSNYRTAVCSGIEEVDKLLLCVHSSPEMTGWWEKRMQKEIIGMFRGAQLGVKELEELASKSSSQREPFSRAANQLLPQFSINIRDMALSLKWIMRGTALVFLCAEYPFFISFFNGTGELSSSNIAGLGVVMVLFFHGKKNAAAAEYGGERAIQWEGRKMQWLLKHLQNNPDNEEKPVTRKKVEKRITIGEKIKLGRVASAKKQKNDKKKTCKKALINTAALLFNMATAFPGFCLNTVQALFAQSCHRQLAIPDEKSKNPAQVVVKRNFPPNTKKPAGSWRTPLKPTNKAKFSAQPLSLSTASSTKATALNEGSKAPLSPPCDPPSRKDNFLQRELPSSARADDEKTESGLPLPSGVGSVEEIKTIEAPSVPSEPLPDDQFRVVKVTTPEFFGGQTFEVKMTNANASEWKAMNFSTTEELEILRTTHKLVCDQATRNFFETAKLRVHIKALEQKKEKVFFTGMMAPHSPDQLGVRREQPPQQLLGNGI